MKTRIFTCVTFCFMSLATFAQLDTLPELPALPEVPEVPSIPTVEKIDKEIEVIVKSDSGRVDTTKIKIGTAKVLIITDGKTTEIAQDQVDMDVMPDSAMSEEEAKKKESKSKISFFEGVELGSAGYTTPAGKFSLPTHLAHMELNYARSYRLNVNIVEKGFNIGTPKVRLVSGVGLSFFSFALDNQTKLMKNNGLLDFTTDTTVNFRKNKLNVQYLNVPLLLCFATKNKEKGSVRLAIGPEVGFRIGTNQKQVYDLNGDKFKPKNKSDFYLSPFLANATARLSFGKLTFFGTYSLNSLFVADKGPGLNVYSVGIRLN